MKKKEKNEWVESLILIAFDEHCNVSFIGKEYRYLELCNDLREFNKDREIKHNFLRNCELIYLGGDLLESSLEDVIYKLLKNTFNKIEPYARIYAEVFKNLKVKDYL
jgi:hypothetical protein